MNDLRTSCGTSVRCSMHVRPLCGTVRSESPRTCRTSSASCSRFGLRTWCETSTGDVAEIVVVRVIGRQVPQLAN